jgi:hypothetical protein
MHEYTSLFMHCLRDIHMCDDFFPKTAWKQVLFAIHMEHEKARTVCAGIDDEARIAHFLGIPVVTMWFFSTMASIPPDCCAPM